METPVTRVVHVNKTLMISLLAGLGLALSYTYWWFQPAQKAGVPDRQCIDFSAEWLGI